jgi:Spx/MgsR family transcriptional regulator
MILYGIPNCDMVRKARRWLEARNIDYRFHDWRADGAHSATLERLADAADWGSLLNRRSATFRKLAGAGEAAEDRDAALDLMVRHPTTIKRPVLESGETVLVGFDEAAWGQVL